MKFFKRLMPNVSTENVIALFKRPLPRITAAARAAFVVLFFASTRLAAQMVEVMPVTAPAINALTESVNDTGAAQIVTHDFDWFDTARNRAVPVRLYLPAQTAPAQTLPLVMFSHGMGGSRRGYSYLGSYWASHGYASLHLKHVGSDRSLWTGNLFGLVGRLHIAAKEEGAIARVGDLRFALDQILADKEIGSMIHAGRIVAAGHSYGANTVMLALGARIERQDHIIDLVEPRLRAAVLLSAPPFYGESNTLGILSKSGCRHCTLQRLKTSYAFRGTTRGLRTGSLFSTPCLASTKCLRYSTADPTACLLIALVPAVPRSICW